MNNLAKPIGNKFATTVKNRVQLRCIGQRDRGAARQAIMAWLRINDQYVIATHGTIGCTGIAPMHTQDRYDERDLIEDFQIYDALHKYPELSISEILTSRNPIIRALGMLDGRIGVARLAKLNVKHEAAPVQRLFEFRCGCEGLPVVRGTHTVKAQKQPKRITVSIPPDPIAPKVSQGGQPWAGATTACAFTKILQGCPKLREYPYCTGVGELHRQKDAWIRPIEKWKPRTYNVDRQFRSLARHLLARYKVPAFMDKAWLSGNDLQREWFKSIGSGENIRKVGGVPLPLTKMMAHYFLTAPEHYTIEGAFRWGQALALGADRRMAAAIVQTRLSGHFIDNAFWQGVIEFFARNPMLDPAQVGPIVDYIFNQKYEIRRAFVERGVLENLGPVQPNFSMKGRTVNSLLRQVDLWHRELGKEQGGATFAWRKSSIADFEFVEGSAENKNMRIWRISELLTSTRLAEEGRQMRHCVASYAYSCQRGDCSIWSMTVETKDGIERVLTIEVRLQTMTIAQVRGKLNRLALPREREIIQRWATRAKLKLQ